MKEKQSYRIVDAPKQPTTTTKVRPIPNIRPIPTPPQLPTTNVRPIPTIPRTLPAPNPGANPLSPLGKVIIIFKVFRRILDAGSTAAPWQDQPNPITGKPNKSKADFDRWQALRVNNAQVKAVRENLTDTQLEQIKNPEKDSKSCFAADIPSIGKTPAQKLAIRFVGGTKNTSRIIVTPKGKLAFYDVQPSVRTVADVDNTSPKSRYSNLRETPELLRKKAIAAECGVNMKIISSDQNVVNQARAEGFDAKRLLLVGAYNKIASGDNAKNVHAHHTPAQGAYPRPNKYANRFDDPRLSVLMTPEDHRRTESFGGNPKSEAGIYRQKQAAYIEQGNFRKAVEMDINDLQKINTDGRYDPSIEALKARLKEMEKNGEIPNQQQQRSTPNTNQTRPNSTPAITPGDTLKFPEVVDPRDNSREQNQTAPTGRSRSIPTRRNSNPRDVLNDLRKKPVDPRNQDPTNRQNSAPTRGNNQPQDILNFPPVTDPRKPNGKESSAQPKATEEQHQEQTAKFVNGANKYLDANPNAQRTDIINAGLQAIDRPYLLANRDQVIKLIGVARDNLTPPQTAMKPKTNEIKRQRGLER
jgi:hypothetical protein